MGAYENALGERLTGATYYIASTGSDSSNGQIATPFKTIQHGIDAAWVGDTVMSIQVRMLVMWIMRRRALY